MKKLIIFSLLSLPLFLAVTQVNAQRLDRANSVKVDRVQKADQVRPANATRLADRCEAVAEKIGNHVERYQNNTDKHQTRYDRIVARLNALVVRLQEAGIDTVELEVAISNFEQKLILFEAVTADYLAHLAEVQGLACSETEGEFRSALTHLKEHGQEVRLSAQDLKAYWQETLRPLITSLLSNNN